MPKDIILDVDISQFKTDDEVTGEKSIGGEIITGKVVRVDPYCPNKMRILVKDNSGNTHWLRTATYK